MDEIVLVDILDREIGRMEKMRAHREGRLHRAFSVFVFNDQGELLLQQRTNGKYHSGGLWSNTCCSHPFPGESISDAAHRRLQEEMGIDCDLQEVFSFTYKSYVGAGLTEYEYDHVLVGKHDGEPRGNNEEVQDWAWRTLPSLLDDIASNPRRYTNWLELLVSNSLTLNAVDRSHHSDAI